MAEVRPLAAIRFDPSRVELSRVLAPPYDVIDPALRRELHQRDPHNIARIDSGIWCGPEGYRTAARQLEAWRRDGVLRRDPTPAIYVLEHVFPRPAAAMASRTGILARIAAREWDQAPIRPHEHTLSAPKEDRMALLRATRTQTSAVFGIWRGAREIEPLLHEAVGGRPAATACLPGEMGDEEIRLWIADPHLGERIQAALQPADLFIADGHHRYETAAAYARQRRQADPAAPPHADFDLCLVHLCSADDPSLVLLATHRLIAPRPGVPADIAAIGESLRGSFTATPVASPSAAIAMAADRSAHEHAYAVIARDGALLLTRERSPRGSARERLDVTVLEEHALRRWGVDAAGIREAALTYERDPDRVMAAVGSGAAALGIILNPCRIDEVLDVALAGDSMPQKSTYFYPKVPTGLVMAPL